MENYIINKDGSVWSNLSNKFLKPKKPLMALEKLQVVLNGNMSEKEVDLKWL